MKIIDIINELNSTTKTNEKVKIISKYKENELFKRVLRLTYDKSINFYIKKIPSVAEHNISLTLSEALDVLEFELATRRITGNAAIERFTEVLSSLDKDDAEVVKLIIEKDLGCGIGIKLINKGLGFELVKDFSKLYMRCNTFNEKRFEKLIKESPEFYVQEKMDGVFANLIYHKDGKKEFISRNGKEIEFFKHHPDKFENILKEVNKFPNGYVFNGELLVYDTEKNAYLKREDGNGILNSKELKNWKDTYEIHYIVWDWLSIDDFYNGLSKFEYELRFGTLKDILTKHKTKFIKHVYTIEVDNLEKVKGIFLDLVSKGSEGVILKSKKALWRSGTPSYSQLKYKIEIDADLEIVEVLEGKSGKLKGKPAIFHCQSSDGLVKVNVGSGMTDEFREKLESDPNSFIGKIATIRFFGLQKAKDSDHYSLYLPRLIELRTDKNESDSLEKIKELIEMQTSIK